MAGLFAKALKSAETFLEQVDENARDIVSRVEHSTRPGEELDASDSEGHDDEAAEDITEQGEDLDEDDVGIDESDLDDEDPTDESEPPRDAGEDAGPVVEEDQDVTQEDEPSSEDDAAIEDPNGGDSERADVHEYAHDVGEDARLGDEVDEDVKNEMEGQDVVGIGDRDLGDDDIADEQEYTRNQDEEEVTRPMIESEHDEPVNEQNSRISGEFDNDRQDEVDRNEYYQQPPDACSDQVVSNKLASQSQLSPDSDERHSKGDGTASQDVEERFQGLPTGLSASQRDGKYESDAIDGKLQGTAETEPSTAAFAPISSTESQTSKDRTEEQYADPSTTGSPEQWHRQTIDGDSGQTVDETSPDGTKAREPSEIVVGVVEQTPDDNIVGRDSAVDETVDGHDSARIAADAPAQGLQTRSDSRGSGSIHLSGEDESTTTDENTNLQREDSNSAGPGQITSLVQALQEEREELLAALDETDNELRGLRGENEALTNNLQQARDILQDVEENLKERMAEVESLKGELQTVKEKADAAEAEVIRESLASQDILERSNKQLETAQRDLDQKLAEAQSKVRHLEEEQERLSSALSREKGRGFTSVEEAMQEAEEATAQLQMEQVSHKETKLHTQKRINELEVAVQSAVNALAEAEERVHSERQTASSAKNRLARAAASMDSEKVEEAMAHSRASELDSMLQKMSFDAEESDESRALATLQSRVDELHARFSERDQFYHWLDEDNRKLRDKVRDATAQSPEAEETVRALREVEEQLLQLADKNLTWQAELEALRSENNALHHQLETERSRMRHAQGLISGASRDGIGARTTSAGRRAEGTTNGEALSTGVPGRLLRLPGRYGSSADAFLSSNAGRRYPGFVLRVVDFVDKQSLHLVTLLRREANVRVAIFFYLFVAHLLVYFLLHFHGHRAGRSSVAPQSV